MTEKLPRILPPIVFLMLLLPLFILDVYHPPAFGELRPSRALPWDLVLPVGLILLIGARIQFKKSDSEIMTFDEPRNLVTTGFFGFSRNPMYLGFTLLLLAAALYVNTACALLAPILFFIIANWWYIPYEEAAAKKAFGSDYTNYVQRVRRWI